MADIGVVIADAWQGHGVGSALTRALMSAATTRGVTAVTMDVLHSNSRVLAMIASHWPAARIGRGADFATVQAELIGYPPTQSHVFDVEATAGRARGRGAARHPGRTAAPLRTPRPTQADGHVGQHPARLGHDLDQYIQGKLWFAFAWTWPVWPWCPGDADAAAPILPSTRARTRIPRFAQARAVLVVCARGAPPTDPLVRMLTCDKDL